MAHTGRLRQKGLLFSGSRNVKGKGFQPLRTLKKLRKRSGLVIDSYDKGSAFPAAKRNAHF